jgi:glyoxalase family protein
MESIKGLHHVTAVTRDAQRNVDFYRNVLGQRLVKRTVNFDAPDTYHLYFADEIGTPGSVVTFFAWGNTPRGVRGNGETAAMAFNVPEDSLGFWQAYLKKKGVPLGPIERRFGVDVLPFDDPDGMRLELAPSAMAPAVEFWEGGPIPQAHAIGGFHSVTLWLAEVEPTADVLNHMGYTSAGEEGNRHRFVGGPGALGSIIDILHRPGESQASFGAGSVHHIAFRVPGDEQQLEYRTALIHAGLGVTPVLDRSYFHSIYFREPGGVLFEIATNTPGFAIDEPQDALGEALKLPEWLEPNHAAIEASLPSLTLKPVGKAA